MTLTPDTVSTDPASAAVPPGAATMPGGAGHTAPVSPWRPQFGLFIQRIERRLRKISPQGWFSIVVVVGCIFFVFETLHPNLVLRNSTPTGGDMGAHLWGPNYLIHHLLPHGEITGWTPDWYAGFPAFQFYMVVPALMVVALDLGVRNHFLVGPALLFVVAFTLSGYIIPALRRWRKPIAIVGLFWCVITLPVPYNIAFKLVTISGLLLLPISCWAFGRLSGLPFPGPPILALGSLYMIYNREPTLNSGTGNIIGGNMASTMAGEFAFMISLAFCVLYLGFLINGLRTGRHRGVAAVLLALTGLCHLIPVFFALAATAIALVVWPGKARLKWAAFVLAVGGLLASFWIVPFELRGAFVNDMGWDKLPSAGATQANGQPQTIWNYLAPHALWWPLALALCGLVVSIVYRYRTGILLAATTVGSGCAFVWIPQARLWNARVLPFFYMSMFLLAAVGISEVVRSIGSLVAKDPEKPGPWATPIGATVCVAFTLLFLGIPLGNLPGITFPATGGVTWLGTVKVDGHSIHLPISIHRSYRNDVPGWAAWNYSGLEAKPATVGDDTTNDVTNGQGGWPELHAMIATMAKLGTEPDHGCGRAMWEYGARLNTYGTPMAPMLLPYYTNSCIGSMEGLYFESSSTTPYHFLTQCALSEHGSCAQRNLDYTSFDHDLGIQQIELLGVKYYMAFSPTAVDAANADHTLKQVAVSGPWHVYQLPAAKSALVEPLTDRPVVMKNVNNTQNQWLDPSAAWFLNPSDWNVMMAESGPKDWTRITIPNDPIKAPKEPEFVTIALTAVDTSKGLPAPTTGSRPVGDRTLPNLPKVPLPKVTVSHIVSTDNRISFDVDKVGTPVLVKTSYFPNWQASGAKGPYRVTPNLMVVVPTSTHVSLHYGRTPVDYLGIFMTLLGLAGLIGLGQMSALAMPAERAWYQPVRKPAPAVAEGPPPVPAGATLPYPGVPQNGSPPPAAPPPATRVDFQQWMQAHAPESPAPAAPHDWAHELDANGSAPHPSPEGEGPAEPIGPTDPGTDPTG